jgi:hypothetical protein
MISIYREQFTNKRIQFYFKLGNKNTFINFSYEVANIIPDTDIDNITNEYLSKLYLKDIYGNKYDIKYFNLKGDKKGEFDLHIIEFNFANNIFYFENDEFHSFDYSMKENGNEIYYIYNKKLTYEEWISHPEKIRYERNKKLQLL